MKKILNNKLLVALFVSIGLASCSNLDTDLLNNPSSLSAQDTDNALLLNNAQIGVGTFRSALNARLGRVMRQRNMFSNYSSDFNSTQPEGWDLPWTTAYRTVIGSAATVESSQEAMEGKIPYYVGEAQVLKTIVMLDLVDVFGNVPYSDALSGNLNPKTDKGVDVYKSALALLDKAETNFKAKQTLGVYPYGGSQDMYYSGDTSKWLKLVNTLRLKILVQTKDAWSDLGIDGAAMFSNIITSGVYMTQNTDDFDFNYSTVASPTDSRHPLYINNYVGSPSQFESNYLIYLMKTDKGLDDPRIRYYFYRQSSAAPSGADLPCNGNPLYTPSWRCYVGSLYRGRAHGDNSGVPADTDRRTIPGLYPAGGAFDNDNFTTAKVAVSQGRTANGKGIIPIIDASFAHFMISELYLKTGNNASALVALNKAVDLSITKVMGFNSSLSAGLAKAPTAAAVSAYNSKVTDLFTASNNKLAVVIKEYLIASYGNGIEAYNAYRRTGLPADIEAPLVEDTFPRTMLYPSVYINSNSSSSPKPVTVKVFWDKNPDGFIK